MKVLVPGQVTYENGNVTLSNWTFKSDPTDTEIDPSPVSLLIIAFKYILDEQISSL